MTFDPSITIKTIDCGICDDITYNIVLELVEDNKQDFNVKSCDLLPLLGRLFELLNAHRKETKFS